MDFQKIIYILKNLYQKTHGKEILLEIINFSEFEFQRHPNHTLPLEWNVYNLVLHLQHEVFIKHYNLLELQAKLIESDIEKLSTLKIGETKFLPDYEKFQIIDSFVKPIYTEWDEINKAQIKLIELLEYSNDSFDFQSIGNISRTIIQKLSSIVYDEKKHVITKKDLKLSKDKYKNHLLAYIQTELAGESNKELRDFAQSLINTVLDAVDLANTVTHKIKGERIFAEVCVLGTINSINIIWLIEKK